MIGFDNLAISVGKVLMCVLKGRNPVVPGKWRSGAGPSVMAGPVSHSGRPSQDYGAPGTAWGSRYGLVTGAVAPGHRRAPPEGIPWAGGRAQGHAGVRCRCGCSSGQAEQRSFSWKAAPAGRGPPALGPPHGAVWQLPQSEGGAALSCAIAKLAPSPAQIPEGGRNQAPCRHLRS